MPKTWEVQVKVTHYFFQNVYADSEEEAVEEVSKNALYWTAAGGEVTLVKAEQKELNNGL